MRVCTQAKASKDVRKRKAVMYRKQQVDSPISLKAVVVIPLTKWNQCQQ